jgi:hypothetical protein
MQKAIAYNILDYPSLHQATREAPGRAVGGASAALLNDWDDDDPDD